MNEVCHKRAWLVLPMSWLASGSHPVEV